MGIGVSQTHRVPNDLGYNKPEEEGYLKHPAYQHLLFFPQCFLFYQKISQNS